MSDTSAGDATKLKEFLDAELFGGLLKGWEHKMKLVTLLPDTAGSIVMVFLESEAFADDVVGLLEHGAKLDYFRNPMKLGAHTLFGGDGMPTMMASSGGSIARARLLHVAGRQLIIEVRKQSKDINEAVKDAQAFYDTLEKRLNVKPEEIVKRYGAV